MFLQVQERYSEREVTKGGILRLHSRVRIGKQGQAITDNSGRFAELCGLYLGWEPLM